MTWLERLDGWLYWRSRQFVCWLRGHRPREWSEQGGPMVICDRCAKALN